MTARMTRAFQAMKAGKDSGQGALEYIGILAVVVVVITAAMTAFTDAGDAITAGVADLIERIFSIGG